MLGFTDTKGHKKMPALQAFSSGKSCERAGAFYQDEYWRKIIQPRQFENTAYLYRIKKQSLRIFLRPIKIANDKILF
jgi:hypothetical protein